MKITIDTASFELMFNNIGNDMRTVGENTVQAIGENIVGLARNTDRFNHGEHFNQGIQFSKTGELQGEVNSVVINSRGTEYSNFLEFGNLPVDGKKMTFQIEGQWITTYKRAAIGEEHLHFFIEAVEGTSDHVQDIFNEEFSKLFNKG